MADDRESLIRQNFELERDFHYWGFRHHHWQDAELVAKCPVPEKREEVLRGFWNRDAEQRYPEYRAAVAGLSLAELEAEQEQWLDRLSLLSPSQYQEILDEAASRQAVNDNDNVNER